MSMTFDAIAPKRPVNLSLNAALVEQARALTGNLSAEVESLLAAFVQQRLRERDAQAERLRRSATAWNTYTDRHGSFADEFSTL
ncbi:MAG: type II toxin-antitoxin system CcdA family antitoxin [Proteobacteria bacterium]|nr:type II toxin-antitoxin system CcdA family antitoxin [Pseudomonadota bacterium]